MNFFLINLKRIKCGFWLCQIKYPILINVCDFRFWHIDTSNTGTLIEAANRLYSEICKVPYMGMFLVYAKRVNMSEAQLNSTLVTDERPHKTLELLQNYSEAARSKLVEVSSKNGECYQSMLLHRRVIT